MIEKSIQLLHNAMSMIWGSINTEKYSVYPSRNERSVNYTSTSRLRAVLVATLVLSSVFTFAQTVIGSYTTSGTQTFVVPPGVTSITTQVWGGGGRGGDRTGLLGLGTAGGGGGGGGAYSLQTIAVTPGQVLTINVGNGSNSASAGGDSWVSTSAVVANAVVLAKGGNSVGGNNTNGATGGSAAAGIGSTKFNGGNGSNSVSNNGGGGGASAGTAANGTSAVNTATGATASTGGGNGGNGQTSGSGNGSNGASPGGAGGGARSLCIAICGSGSGGNGAAGQVIITCTDIGTPVFALGATSTRCQAAGTVNYTATSTNTTNLTYALDAASLAAGNTINASTGAVTYAAAWSGTSTVTVTAVGCAGPKTATHTITNTASAGVPVFTLGATSQRCAGAGTVSYVATSANSTGIVYALDPASLAAGNTINTSTGLVTYTASWSGISTITATASGCFNVSATHQADSGSFFVNDDAYITNQGQPITFNVLANDLCNINPSTVTITQQPVGGFVTLGANGQMTYVSFGAFLGTETIKYQVCSNGPTVTCKIATVTINVLEVPDDPCFLANKEKTYYLPFPENDAQLKQSLLSAASANLLTANVRSIVSISVPYPGTNLIYDQWEDGYEADIKNPAQGSTQIWGDGIISNGVAPGFPTDVIPAGGFITLDNTFPWSRPTTTLAFDGKDKIFSTANISVSKVNGDAGTVAGPPITPLFNVQSVKTNVSDITRFGNFFVLPFGENVTNGPTTAFRYTGLFVRAKDNGTVVQLDYDGNGSFDVTSPTLNEGEVWFYNGVGSTPGIFSATVADDVDNATDIKAGARVSANNPVGIDLVFGGIDTYGTRNIPVLPSQFYGTTYYSPVYSTNTAAPALAYFVNPTASAITINWSRASGTPLSGSFTVPANNGRETFNLNVATGTKFTSAGGESYTAVVVMDADDTGSGYDWAFNMIPEKRLSSAALVAWAPGSSDGSANYNPVWVTPKTTTTVYVKYDGNVTAGPNQSPCGGYYDVSFTVNALESRQIKNPGSSNDNSGMAVYNCNDVPMAMVWGQSSETTTPGGSPALDVGYTMEPKCFAKIVFAADDKVITPQNTPITINVAGNDTGFLVVLNPANSVVITQPTNGTIVKNPSGTYTYTPNAGFTGQDSFTYNICGQGADSSICDLATVFINIPCAIVVDANVISGTVYNDVNGNGTPNAGEAGVSAISVQLYDDLNSNGVIDTLEPVLQTQSTTSGANAGTFQFNLPNSTYLDQFNTNGSATGSNGTTTWVAPWLEIGEATGFGLGNIQVTGNKLRIQGNGLITQIGASRTANLLGAGQAELTFDFDKSAFNTTPNDWVDVQVASSPLGPWVTLARYSGLPAATGSQTFAIPTALISATTTIRFIESNDNLFTSSERVDFDNVKIRYVLDKKYIVKLASPIANSWVQSSTPVTTAVGIKNFSDGDCSTKFGLVKSDVVITKTVNNPFPIFGSNVTFTLTANNEGPSDAPSVTVNDALPTGYMFVSATPSVGTYTGGVWTIGTLANGATETLTIVATFKNTGNYTNTAVISTTGNDPNLTNNTSSVTPIPQMDSDGDGVGDLVDIDDDNDGILDTDEQTCLSPISIGVNPNPTASEIYGGTTATYTEVLGSVAPISFGGYNGFNPSGYPSKLKIDYSKTLTNYAFRISDLDNLEKVRVLVYDKNGVLVPNILPYITYQGADVLASAQSSMSVLVESNTNTGGAGNSFNANIYIDFKLPFEVSRIDFDFYDRSNGSPEYYFLSGCVVKDTDGDTIPDYLDLDSDNDGCLDAIEGSANISLSELVSSGGTVVVGTGSTASNQNLCENGACVNAQGLPQLSPLISGYSNTTGQGVGTSANSSIKNAQCANAFGCDSRMYLSQVDTLYDVDTTSNPFTYPSVGTSSVNYNAIAINPLDGRLYGMQVSNSNNVVVINTDGSSINLGPVTNLPTGVTYNAGEIDNLGNYYVKVNNENPQLYKINLNTLTATLITLNTSIYVPDIAFNITTGLLYGVNVTTGQLVSINPATSVVTPIGITPGSALFGAMFASSTGEIYGAENGGGFYQFNLTTGQRVLISNAPGSNGNDGAHCVTAPIVFSADLAITKTDGKINYSSGTTNTYTVVVSNNGPFGVLGATVSDPVPAGIPAGNVSYSVPVVTGGATTSITSAQTGALNDVVNVPVGGTITYTITIAIPISYSGDLVNVATVTSPANSTDSDSTNNTATDTDTAAVCYNNPNTTGTGVDTKHGITLLQRAGSNNGGWPMIRKSAHTVLESNTKGFVVSRVTTLGLSAITNPQEGMMVYDTVAECLKIFDGTVWSCFNTPACP